MPQSHPKFHTAVQKVNSNARRAPRYLTRRPNRRGGVSSATLRNTRHSPARLPSRQKKRRKKLAKAGRCCCTSWGHQSKRCKSKVRCLHFSRRHASSVCNHDWGKAGRDFQEETAPKEVATTNVHAATKRETNDEVALQAFCSWAVGENKCGYIRGVLDGGSQKTLIREDVFKTLNLRVSRRKDFHLNTLGMTAAKTESFAL